MSEAMTETTELAPFDSMTDAEDAYFGDGEGRTRVSDWGEWDDIDVLPYFWILIRQYAIEGDDTRYFLLYGPDEDNERVINQSGGHEPFSESVPWDELPAHDTEEDAREAHAAWVEQYGDQYEDRTGEESGEGEWLGWDEYEEQSPWFVLFNEHTSGTVAYAISGVDADGAEVYLAPGVSIQSEMHIYEELDDVYDALAAYFDAEEQGDVPEGDQPTGERPSMGAIEEDGENHLPGPDGGLGGAGGIVSTIASNPLLLVVIVVAVYLLYRRYQAQAGDGAVDAPEVDPGGGPEL